ncbi:uncharacterized protein [Miscanthus floridulus]|uniref:uncharacterized protein n=1 Tax=Miscanthus floridulus TaxID=154761 RepID=UPI0034574C33
MGVPLARDEGHALLSTTRSQGCEAKDAKAAKRTKKILTREELDKRRRQQRKDGLPLEESPSPSLLMEASDGDDEGEVGRGPLDHLPNIVEVVPRALASSPALPGGGGADPGLAIACSGAEADTLEARVLGKCAGSPVGSAAAVEQVAVEAMQLPPQRTKGAPGSIEDQPAPMDIQKQPTEVPNLAPLKVLKVTPGSIAHWVVEAQAALHRGAASARPDPKEPATQGGATEVALIEEGEAAPLPRDGEAYGSDAAEVPLAVETTGTEVPRVLQAGATETAVPGTIEAAMAGTGSLATTEATMAEARAPETAEASMAEARAPRTTEATMAKAGAPGATDANAIMAGLPA